MVQFENIDKNVLLVFNLINYMKDIEKIEIIFELKVKNKEHRSYTVSSRMTKQEVIFLLNNLKGIYDREVDKFEFYPFDMFAIFNISRYHDPDADIIEWTVKFVSGVLYGPEHSGFSEAIIFRVDDEIIRQFVQDFESYLTSMFPVFGINN